MSTNKEHPTKQSLPRTTAAKRLHRFLLQLRDTSGSHFYATLPQVLAIKPKQNASLEAIEALQIVGEMVDDLKTEVEKSGLNSERQEFYLRCVPGIVNALSLNNLSLGWQQAREKISLIDLNHLENVDSVVSAKGCAVVSTERR